MNARIYLCCAVIQSTVWYRGKMVVSARSVSKIHVTRRGIQSVTPRIIFTWSTVRGFFNTIGLYIGSSVRWRQLDHMGSIVILQFYWVASLKVSFPKYRTLVSIEESSIAYNCNSSLRSSIRCLFLFGTDADTASGSPNLARSCSRILRAKYLLVGSISSSWYVFTSLSVANWVVVWLSVFDRLLLSQWISCSWRSCFCILL